jgi:hypothetical protein
MFSNLIGGFGGFPTYLFVTILCADLLRWGCKDKDKNPE